ncbi:MAG TPA: hypothetical protein VGH28_24030 [Polyangiaceae bacterium]
MRWRLLAAASVCFGLAACANILGIDDGVPRTGDAGFDAPFEAAALDGGTDAKPDGPFSPLSCGNTVCNFALGQTCCRTGANAYACVASGSSCNGTSIPCDRPSQCPSTDAGASTCCTTDVLNEAGTDYVAESVACMPYQACLGIPAHYILCGDGDGGDCPTDAGCAESTSTLPPFLICR